MSQVNEKMRERLLNLVFERAFTYNEEKPFILSSGKTSTYYLDCRKVTLIPEGMDCIGRLIFENIQDLKVQGIGGLTLGADPIAYAVMSAAYQNQPNRQYIKTFIVRKEKKGHGLQREIEGDLRPGDRAVVVDDVVTTGQSTITAIERAKAFGLLVEKAIVLIDRQEENGLARIRETGVPVEALLSREEIIARYRISLQK
ncbi:MAG: orotate phosphoribosyltransferase [bacterium]